VKTACAIYTVKRVKRTVFVLALLFTPASIAAQGKAQSVKSYQKKITQHTDRADSIKQLIAQGEKRLRKLREDETSTLRQLEEMDANAVLAKRLLSELSAQAVQVEKDINQAKLSADSAGTELQARQAIMEQRLRQIYKTGTITLPALLLGSSSPTELLRRIKFAADLNRYDQKILGQIGEEKQKRTAKLQLLTVQRQHSLDLKRAKERESLQLEKQKVEREHLVASIRSEKSEWLVELEELRVSQRKLNALVDDLIRQRDAVNPSAAPISKPTGTGFARFKGTLPWPIAGKVISSYGKQTHPVYGTVITNKGIGIAAAAGVAVRAVAAGVVEYTGKLPGYGKVVIVSHTEGFMTIYAHLGSSNCTKGLAVTSGMIIGTVGVSEGMSGQQLHFEIRHKTDTENPLDWLRK